jgi:hypothetical protein
MNANQITHGLKVVGFGVMLPGVGVVLGTGIIIGVGIGIVIAHHMNK